MRLLIDGYNLLNATGIDARGYRIGSLERSRLGLLHFLFKSLDPPELSQTTVVFDSTHAPPGLPRVTDYHGLTVRFAVKYESADALIEELIRADSTPRRLTVVSSDHRIQRAARRRKARAVDSQVWYGEIVRRNAARARPGQPAIRPRTPLVSEDVARWLERFGGETAVQSLLEEERSPPVRALRKTAWQIDPHPQGVPQVEPEKNPADLFNPFPPGYGEDLLEDP
jgi:hypothetical protein